MTIELDLQSRLLIEAPKAIPNLRLFRRQVHMLRTEDGRTFRAGIKGQADLYGFMRGGSLNLSYQPVTVPIEIELKSATARTTKEQLAWETFCKEWRIRYLRLKALRKEAPKETVARWVKEIRGAI